jgi:uncharacterized protein
MLTIELSSALQTRLAIKLDQLSEYCQRRHIVEFALFGSILRDDFQPHSDIDILVTFQPNAKISLIDLVDMQYELENLLHRKIDLLTKKSVEDSPNWIRRKEILNTARVVYESRSNLPA